MGGSCFLHVGDGDQPYLIALFGLLELPIHRCQRAFLCIQIVLRSQHVEVALRHPRDQVLLRRLIVGFGLGDLRVGALQRHPVLPAE